MRHLGEVDQNDYTVIMVRGKRDWDDPDSRDRSAVANKLFNERVPTELMSICNNTKNNVSLNFVRCGMRMVSGPRALKKCLERARRMRFSARTLPFVNQVTAPARKNIHTNVCECR